MVFGFLQINMIKKLPDLSNVKTAVLGLGYVGLPLAVQIAKVKKNLVTDRVLNRKVIGFDIIKKGLMS